MSDFETSDNFDSSMSVSSTSSTHSSMSSLASDEILDGVLPEDRVRQPKQGKRLRKSTAFDDAVQDDKESAANMLPLMQNFRNDNMILSDLSLSSSDEDLNISTAVNNSSRTGPRYENTPTHNVASTEMAQDTPKDASDSQEDLHKHCVPTEESNFDVLSLACSSLSSISSRSSEGSVSDS